MSSDSWVDDPLGERSRYVGATIRVPWQWVHDQIYSGVVAAGFDDLNPAHVELIRYPTLGGLRPTKLAGQVGITKQSVNDLLGHLERHGYLVRVPDPADGRARVIRLTAKGQRLERTINAQAQAPEMRVAEILGRDASPNCTAPLSYSPSDSVKQPMTTRNLARWTPRKVRVTTTSGVQPRLPPYCREGGTFRHLLPCACHLEVSTRAALNSPV